MAIHTLSALLDDVLEHPWEWGQDNYAAYMIAADAAQDADMPRLAAGLRLLAAGKHRPLKVGGPGPPWRWWAYEGDEDPDGLGRAPSLWILPVGVLKRLPVPCRAGMAPGQWHVDYDYPHDAVVHAAYAMHAYAS